MLPQLDINDPTPVVVSPLGNRCVQFAEEIAAKFQSEGIDVSIDRRIMSIGDRLRSLHSAGVLIFSGVGDEEVRRQMVKVKIGEDYPTDHISLEAAVDIIRDNLHDSSGSQDYDDDEEEEDDDEDDAPIADAPPARIERMPWMQSGGAPVGEAAREEEADDKDDAPQNEGDIASFPVDTDTWKDHLSKHRQERIREAKSEWTLPPKASFPVIYGDRVYLSATQASTANGLSGGNLAFALRKEKTEYRGTKIAFADPVLEAIRLGMSREEYAAQLKQNPTTAPTPGAAVSAGLGRNVLAQIVRQDDGTLALSGDFDLETTTELMTFLRSMSDRLN